MYKWNTFHALHINDYLSASNKKQAEKLNEQRNKLLKARSEFDAELEKIKNAPITEVIDTSFVESKRAHLLAEELKLRKEFASYYPEPYKDRRKASEKSMKARNELPAKLVALGFYEKDAENFVKLHPVVVGQRLESEALRTNQFEQLERMNGEAIELLVNELSKRRKILL